LSTRMAASLRSAIPNVPATGPVLTRLLGINDGRVGAGFYADVNGNSQGFLCTVAGGTFTSVLLPASFNATMTVASGASDAGMASGFYLDGVAGNAHTASSGTSACLAASMTPAQSEIPGS
jgi:hypothetical protein